MSQDAYPGAAGFVQKFGADKPAVVTKDVNGQTVREFTIKALVSQKLIKVTVWPEFSDVEVHDGDFVAVEGKVQVNESNGRTYYNVNAMKLAVTPGVRKQERETVNRQAAAQTTDSEDSPF